MLHVLWLASGLGFINKPVLVSWIEKVVRSN